MIRYLKTGQLPEEKAEKQAEVRRTVEGILDAIAKRGEAAVRDYSRKFDQWDPASFRLGAAEVEACMRQVPAGVKADIEFAQKQIRNFALAQKASMQDIEIETMPGVILGHRQLPVNSVGCYVPAAAIRW
jgi:sulfopropanediol 3-dehydrogenase